MIVMVGHVFEKIRRKTVCQSNIIGKARLDRIFPYKWLATADTDEKNRFA